MILDWPFSTGMGRKPRPALIAQNDRDNQRLTNAIVAMITSRIHRAGEPTQLFIDISTLEGRQTGLRQDSVVNCVNLFTIDQSSVLHTIGIMPASLMTKIDSCLKIALDLP